MRKSRIEVRADAVARSEARELAELAADDWHDQGSQPFNDDIDTDNELALVNLAEFGLPSKTSLTYVVIRICKKWLIDNYLISNKINLITSIITSSGTAVANHLEKSIIIRPCQVPKVDQLDENHIREISDKTVYNWKQMIRKGRELSEIQINLANTGYEINNNNSVGVLEPIRGEMAIKK